MQKIRINQPQNGGTSSAEQSFMLEQSTKSKDENISHIKYNIQYITTYILYNLITNVRVPPTIKDYKLPTTIQIKHESKCIKF